LPLSESCFAVPVRGSESEVEIPLEVDVARGPGGRVCGNKGAVGRVEDVVDDSGVHHVVTTSDVQRGLSIAVVDGIAIKLAC